MPLREGQPPRLTDTRYYSGDPQNWSQSPDDAVAVFEHEGFTSVSIAWLEGPQRWIVPYSQANDVNRFDYPAVACIGTSPWDWSAPSRSSTRARSPRWAFVMYSRTLFGNQARQAPRARLRGWSAVPANPRDRALRSDSPRSEGLLDVGSASCVRFAMPPAVTDKEVPR